MRIIGYGNPDRGDDSAGLLVARELQLIGIGTEIYTGDPLRLLESLKPSDEVVVIDAVLTGTHPGTIHEWDASQPLNLETFPASSHGLGLGEAIELARNLGTLPKLLRVYGIEGKQFVVGTSPQPAVRDAVQRLVKQIASELSQNRL